MMINAEIRNLDHAVRLAGGNLYVVGGAVRDFIMGLEPTDMDFAVEGMSQTDFLESFPRAEKVIDNAPVFLVWGYHVALCRAEISTGEGKHDFQFVADPNVTITEDLRRRDFTCNAMAYHVQTGVILDPFGGKFDIRDRILRPVSEAFIESPERVLRGASFAARFDFDVTESFIDYAVEMSAETISTDQIWLHFSKALSKAVKPSRFIEVLIETGWGQNWPEIWSLMFCEQDPEYHPEGDALTHTMHVMNSIPEGNLVLQLAAITHDMGKPKTFNVIEGRITSHGHTHTDDAENFLVSIGCPIKIREQVLSLVRCHMDHVGATVSKRFVRRLALRLQPATIQQLADLVRADYAGRPPLEPAVPDEWVSILSIANDLKVTVEPVKPLVMGRHLIAEGHKPGPSFGIVLDFLMEMQLDGDFETLERGLDILRLWMFGNETLDDLAEEIQRIT